MDYATLLLKKVPSDLKQWLANEAERNDRSMNKEAIRLLEEARSLRGNTKQPTRDAKAIEKIFSEMKTLPVLDKRPLEEVLYDKSGMPK